MLKSLSDNQGSFNCGILDKLSATFYKGPGLLAKVKSNSFRCPNHLAYLLVKFIYI